MTNILRHVCQIALLTATIAAAQGDPASAPASQAVSASAPATSAADGAYVHPGTKFPFPKKLEGFSRVDVTKFAADESDVGIGYNSDDPTNRIVVTIFIFPAPPLPEGADGAKQQFDRALTAVKKEIAGEHEDAKIVSEGPFKLAEGDRTHEGTKVSYDMTYSFKGNKELAASDAILFVEGKWQIEYRISYPKANAEIAKLVIDKLLNALVWKDK